MSLSWVLDQNKFQHQSTINPLEWVICFQYITCIQFFVQQFLDLITIIFKSIRMAALHKPIFFPSLIIFFFSFEWRRFYELIQSVHWKLQRETIKKKRAAQLKSDWHHNASVCFLFIVFGMGILIFMLLTFLPLFSLALIHSLTVIWRFLYVLFFNFLWFVVVLPFFGLLLFCLIYYWISWLIAKKPPWNGTSLFVWTQFIIQLKSLKFDWIFD